MDTDALLTNSACMLRYPFFLTVIDDHRSVVSYLLFGPKSPMHIHELAYVLLFLFVYRMAFSDISSISFVYSEQFCFYISITQLACLPEMVWGTCITVMTQDATECSSVKTINAATSSSEITRDIPKLIQAFQEAGPCPREKVLDIRRAWPPKCRLEGQSIPMVKKWGPARLLFSLHISSVFFSLSNYQ